MRFLPLSRHVRRVLLVVLAGIALSAHAATRYAGRPLGAVLAELQGPGLALVYNNQLVPDSLVVSREPKSTAPLPLLREILGDHGLGLRQMGPGTWAVVRLAPAPPATPAIAGPRLDEIVVTTSQYRLLGDGPAQASFIDQENLRDLPKLADDSLRAIHRLPGAASNGLSGLAYIRGGDARETGLLLDGMPLREPFHLKSFLSPVSLLDPAIVAGLKVYAGGYPADFGSHLSAIIDVDSIEPPDDHRYELGLSLFHTSALATGTFANGRGRLIASARRSNLAEVMNLAESDLGEPRYLDSFLKAEYSPDDATTFAAHALFARDRIELNNSEQTEFARTNDQNSHLWLTAEHRWSPQVIGRALIGLSGIDNDRSGRADDPGRRTGTVTDNRSTRSSLLKMSLDFGTADIQWRIGMDASWLEARYDYRSAHDFAAGYPFPGDPAASLSRNAALDPDGAAVGTFVAGRWQPMSRVTLEAGLRWDDQGYDHAGGASQVSPRINLLYEASARTRLRASWGRFFQPQGINELQVEDGIDHFFPAQRADHFILSLEHTWKNRWSTRVEAYYKDYEKPMPRFENLFDPLVILPELESDRVGIVPEAGTVEGVELLVQDRTPRDADHPWNWWFSYTWSRAEEKVDGAWVPRSWDQRHALNGGASWTSGPWELSLAGTWHTGWPTTPVTLDGTGDVVIGARNSARFDAFSSVDLRAAYTFRLPSSELLAFVQFTNLLGTKNACCAEYSVIDDGNGTPVLHGDRDHWPRFVPNLGVYWRF